MSSERMQQDWDHPTVYRPDLFAGKTALICGGSSGIGRATALLFARLGAKVMIVGRRQEKIDAVLAFAKDKGVEMHGFATNLKEHDNVLQVFEATLSALGPVDYLVNSAGGHFAQDAIDISAKGWKTVIANNLDNTWFVMQRAAQLWKEQGRGGSVINIIVITDGSMYGVTHTIAARAGIIGAMRSAAVEWAPLGIRVNCIAPGLITTEGHDIYSDEGKKDFAMANPFKRPGVPGDIAEASVYLSADSGNFITGEVLTIDGGGKLWGDLWLSGRPDWFRADS